MVLQGGEPFFLQGCKHGVILTHGFTGTPAEMLLLGRYLHAQGYTVLGIRLAFSLAAIISSLERFLMDCEIIAVCFIG